MKKLYLLLFFMVLILAPNNIVKANTVKSYTTNYIEAGSIDNINPIPPDVRFEEPDMRGYKYYIVDLVYNTSSGSIDNAPNTNIYVEQEIRLFNDYNVIDVNKIEVINPLYIIIQYQKRYDSNSYEYNGIIREAVLNDHIVEPFTILYGYEWYRCMYSNVKEFCYYEPPSDLEKKFSQIDKEKGDFNYIYIDSPKLANVKDIIRDIPFRVYIRVFDEYEAGYGFNREYVKDKLIDSLSIKSNNKEIYNKLINPVKGLVIYKDVDCYRVYFEYKITSDTLRIGANNISVSVSLPQKIGEKNQYTFLLADNPFNLRYFIDEDNDGFDDETGEEWDDSMYKEPENKSDFDLGNLPKREDFEDGFFGDIQYALAIFAYYVMLPFKWLLSLGDLLLSYIKQILSQLTQIGNLLGGLFPFIPQELNTLIWASLTITLIMKFIFRR